MSVLASDLLETALKHRHCSGQTSLSFQRPGLGTEGPVVETPGNHANAETGSECSSNTRTANKAFFPERLSTHKKKTGITMVRGGCRQQQRPCLHFGERQVEEAGKRSHCSADFQVAERANSWLPFLLSLVIKDRLGTKLLGLSRV